MDHLSLDMAAQDERDLIAAIKQTSNRLTLPVLAVLGNTFALPFLVFVVLGVAGEFARQYIRTNFGDTFLSFTTTLSSYIVLFGGVWFAWRWSERRFGGAALIRGLAGVLRQVAALETAIEQAKGGQDADPAAERLSADAYAAWEHYTAVMRAAGFTIDDQR